MIQADGCSCAGTPIGPEKCANRTVMNAFHCSVNVTYGFFITHRNLERRYSFSDGVFMEFTDGTAILTGRVTNNGDARVAFDVNFTFTGRTTNSPTGEAREHTCLEGLNTSGFYFYEDVSGTLTGRDLANGALINVRNTGAAFQVGNGANITNNVASFGASGWLLFDILREPTTGFDLDIILGGNNQNGDININLSGDGTECFNSASGRAAPQFSFEAFRKNRSVAMQWITNTGWKNNYFELEHSTDGEHFESIAKVMNDDLTDDLTFYSDIDNTPALGDNLYRVKQVYVDGSFDYSEIELVNFNIDFDNLSIYPNPAQNLLNFNLKPVIGKEVTIQILNTFGQVVSTSDLGVLENESVQIPLSDNMSNGFYQVFIEVSGQKPITRKLVVKRLY